MVGVIEGPIATKRSPQERERITMVPWESWMVMELRSGVLALDKDVGPGGSEVLTRLLVLVWKGL